MYYPNRLQWFVIWVSALLALVIWVGSANSDDAPERLALSFLVIGALLVWALSRRRAPTGTTPSSVTTCAQCGSPVQAGSVHCSCGAVLLPDEQVRRLTGPRGWIALLCLGLLVFQPLSVFSQGVATFKEGVTPLGLLRVSTPLIITGASAVYGFIVALLLLQKSAVAVWHARLYLKAQIIGAVALVIWSATVLGANEGGYLAGQLLFPALSVPLWLAYFRKSKRVALTYGPQSQLPSRGLAQVAFLSAAAALVVGVPVGTLNSSWGHTADSWIAYAPAAGGFSVQLPAAPKVEKKPTGELVLTRASVETADSMEFAIVFMDLPLGTDVANPGTVLDAVAKAEANHLRIASPETRTVQVAGYSGLEVSGRRDDWKIRLRFVLVGHRMYELLATTPGRPSTAHITAVDRFLESFILIQ